MNNKDINDLLERTMDLSDLSIFRTVVQEGGITRAAERLHRVQSNVTTRVRQLEEDLGVDLFIREGKRLHLSPSGTLLLGYADRLIDLAEEARDAVHDAKPRGRFRLGSIESAAAMRLPAPLNEYHHRFPEVTLELQTGSIQDLSAKVLHGDLDAAVVAEPVADAPFEKATLYEEELAIIATVRHRPIKSPRDLQPQTMLVREVGCPYRLRLDQWFKQSGEMPERIIEMTSWHAILACTATGMGVAALPKMLLTTFPDRKFLSVHSLPKNLSTAPTVLIWRKGMQSPKVNALLDVLKAERGEERLPTKRSGSRKGRVNS
jgi:DNA-binding transcriptional LysR family regulator